MGRGQVEDTPRRWVVQVVVEVEREAMAAMEPAAVGRGKVMNSIESLRSTH